MVEINGQVPISSVETENRSCTLPYGAKDHAIVDGTIVIVLGSWKEPNFEFWENMGLELSDEEREADITLESKYRNVIGLSNDGEIQWEIPDAPHKPPEDTDPYYMGLWQIGDTLWVRNKNQYAYRVDPDSGELLESVPANVLRLGGQTIEFDSGWVGKVLPIDDDLVAVMLETSGHPDSDGRNLYVFERDGSERWWVGDHLRSDAPPSAPPFTDIWLDDGDLCGYATDGYEYRFDPETGELRDTVWRK